MKKKVKINFKFREKLNSVLGGEHHNFCYQCGACVSVCPAARYSEEFNPRLILLKALLGLEELLIQPNSPIWLCTNCYSCYERCPQDVRPIEVIIALKNLAVEKGNAPKDILKFSETITRTGVSGIITASVNERRKKLGLDSIKERPLDELKKIL